MKAITEFLVPEMKAEIASVRGDIEQPARKSRPETRSAPKSGTRAFARSRMAFRFNQRVA